LLADEALYGRVKNGSWINITDKIVNGTQIVWDKALEHYQNDIEFKVMDIAGNENTTVSVEYFLDPSSPIQTVTHIDISRDYGFSDNDFITNQADQTVTALLSTYLSTEQKLFARVDGGEW